MAIVLSSYKNCQMNQLIWLSHPLRTALVKHMKIHMMIFKHLEISILSPLYTDGKAEAKTRRLRAIIYNPSIAFEPVLWYNKLTDGFGCCCRRKGEFQWYQDT